MSSTPIEISKPIIEDEEIDAVVGVLKSRQLSQGPVVAAFEKAFAKRCGASYAVAVNNGTSSLHALLYAYKIEEADEVITSPFTFVATGNAILMQQARVVFCDIDDRTYNLDPDRVVSHVSKATKAIMPVSLFGHIYDVKRINAIGKNHKIPIIEDAAQSVGATYQSRYSGNVADAGSFSLYATKNIASGLGGVITTRSKRIAQRCKLFRHHGQDEKKQYEYIDFGYNYRMNDMIAAIAREQLKKLRRFTKARRTNALYYDKHLADIPGIVLPDEQDGYRHVYHQYTIRVTREARVSRDRLLAYLVDHNVGARVYYPKPLHLFPHFRAFGYARGDFPVAEKASREVLSLPVHPLVTREQLSYIVRTVKAGLRHA